MPLPDPPPAAAPTSGAAPSSAAAPSSGAAPVAQFAVTVLAEPGLLPRVLDEFAKRGLVPDRVSALRRGDALAIEADVPGLDPATAGHVARRLRAGYGVVRVLLAADPAP